MTINEFLASPEKQDALIRYRAEKDYAKYGNWDDVASVWFSGRPVSGNTSSDVLGTTVTDYINKFREKASIGNNNETSKISEEAKNWLTQYNSGALELGDIYTKIGNSKEALNLKNEVAAAVAAQGGKRVYQLDDDAISSINLQIKTINDLLNADWKSIVGPIRIGNPFNKSKEDALNLAKSILASQTLQALADAKAKGVTFGALSEGELTLVADTASRLSASAKKEDGKIKSFTGSETTFKNNLNIILTNLQKAMSKKTKNVNTQNDTMDFENTFNQINSQDALLNSFIQSLN